MIRIAEYYEGCYKVELFRVDETVSIFCFDESGLVWYLHGFKSTGDCIAAFSDWYNLDFKI